MPAPVEIITKRQIKPKQLETELPLAQVEAILKTTLEAYDSGAFMYPENVTVAEAIQLENEAYQAPYDPQYCWYGPTVRQLGSDNIHLLSPCVSVDLSKYYDDYHPFSPETGTHLPATFHATITPEGRVIHDSTIYEQEMHEYKMHKPGPTANNRGEYCPIF